MTDSDTWDSHDRDTGPYCRQCGGDSAVCGECRESARDAEWRAAVAVVRGRIPRGGSTIDAALENIADATLDALLAVMEAK